MSRLGLEDFGRDSSSVFETQMQKTSRINAQLHNPAEIRKRQKTETSSSKKANII